MSPLYHQYPAAGAQGLLSKPPVPRRSLPPVPQSTRPRIVPRPLPPIPRLLACKSCRTCITSTKSLLPLSSIPQSRGFRGFSGKASLFTEIYNVSLALPAVRLMTTGAHTLQEISCITCASYLGWKIVRAHDRSERWKEGNCLLELESLYGIKDGPLSLGTCTRVVPHPDDSEDSS